MNELATILIREAKEHVDRALHLVLAAKNAETDFGYQKDIMDASTDISHAWASLESLSPE